MAFLYEDDKLNDNQGAGSSAGSAPMVGAGAGDVGSGVSTAGVGAGGTGGWTNIQAYLNANKGNNTTANALKNTVGSEFDQEQSKLSTESDKAKGDANKYLQDNVVGNDQVNDYILQAADGGRTEDGSLPKEKVSGFLNSTYGGPNQFAYGLGAKTQEYGTNLGSDQNFDALMGDVYNKAAGGQISSGQRALQKQLDVNNPTIASARSDLKSRYDALKDMAGLKTKETADALTNAQSTYTQKQSDLKNNLNNRASTLNAQISEIRERGPSGKYGDLSRQYVNQYNAIQDFLGLGGHMPHLQFEDPIQPGTIT